MFKYEFSYIYTDKMVDCRTPTLTLETRAPFTLQAGNFKVNTSSQEKALSGFLSLPPECTFPSFGEKKQRDS